jgi:hypothetical protein
MDRIEITEKLGEKPIFGSMAKTVERNNPHLKKNPEILNFWDWSSGAVTLGFQEKTVTTLPRVTTQIVIPKKLESPKNWNSMIPEFPKNWNSRNFQIRLG